MPAASRAGADGPIRGGDGGSGFGAPRRGAALPWRAGGARGNRGRLSAVGAGAPGPLVLASGVAFALSELADFAVYTPLQRRRLMLAMLASALVGLAVDSLAFLWLAFGSLHLLPGQIVGKLWAVLASIPFIRLLRRVAPTPA